MRRSNDFVSDAGAESSAAPGGPSAPTLRSYTSVSDSDEDPRDKGSPVTVHKAFLLVTPERISMTPTSGNHCSSFCS
jgi:hypothetical protein